MIYYIHSLYSRLSMYLIILIVICLPALALPTMEPSESQSFSDRPGISNSINIISRRASITTASTSDSEMPTPFDTVSVDFANATCTTFFDNFLANDTVTNCHAVSLLLQHSNSFFHILSSAAQTSRVLDTTCSEDVSQCASIMTSLAQEMLSDDHCGADYNSGNVYVKATYQDLMAYEPVYHATCLINPTTKDYCFVDAVTNSSAPGDYPVYFIPLGTTLTVTNITCNECLQATMNIYAKYAQDDNQALDGDYTSSAKRVNEYCGANFANTSVTLGSDSVTADGLMSLPSTRLAVILTSLALGFTSGLI